MVIEVSKKYLKKLLKKKERTRCKICNRNMKHVELYENGEAKELYRCSNIECDFEVDVTKKTMLLPAPKEEQTILEVVQYKLEDKEYDVEFDGKKIQYNPISMVLSESGGWRKATDQEQNIFYNIIQQQCQDQD